MALQLKVSNSLNILAKYFCEDLKSQKISVFQPYYLVTQTDGMNNWLKMQLADNLGIAANYRFLKPNDLINQIYAVLGGDFMQPLSAENQSWLLFKILAEKDFIKRFKHIADYYTEDNPDKDLKRMALAEKIADLFDQYQIYRPEMIRDWNTSTLQDLQKDDWQMYLWIKAKEISGDKMPDKTFVGNYIIDELKNPVSQKRLQNNMPAVFLFGLSVTTDFHMQIFHEVGKVIDISYYLLNPAPGLYWFEDLSEKQAFRLQRKGLLDHSDSNLGNNLLTSWGKVIQHTFAMLFKSDELINNYEEVAIREPKTDTLLHQIQSDIFYNLSDAERENISIENIKDGSLSIHSSYTPAREVEALYNFLVGLVDQKKEALSPRDIVVMVSDIDSYAPYIKAVFRNAPYQFYFSIADESYSSNDTIAAALIALMEMNSQNFKAEDVLQLLDFGYIRKRFGITDIALIRKVVDTANIRFGIDGEIADDSVYVSWNYGLEKIIYGICMSGDEEYFTDEHSLYPVDMVEGTAAQELIKFAHFVQVLIASITYRDRNRNISDWVKYVEKLLIDLVFDPGENADEDYAVLLKQLEKYNAINALLTDDLSYQLFSHSFLNSVQSSVRTGSFAGGGITFCSLIPMRSIPFKVVALLGLHFDKFPRKENQVNFNLMNKNPRKGDRNVKENDKHLFLETLLSAQDYLYISYIGQSAKDNSSIPPSALVDELIDYLQTKYTVNDELAKEIIVKHALHSFSLKNQQSGKINYLAVKDSAKHRFFLTQQKEVLTFNQIAVKDFINFFKNPFKAYFNKVLRIYYNNDDTLLTDTELFDINHLQSWRLKQNLLHLKPTKQVLLKDRLLKTGGLPLKNMANVVFEQTEEVVANIRYLYDGCIENEEEKTLAIDLDIDESRVKFSGKIDGIYGNKMVAIAWSKSETKYLLEAYLKYLLLQANGYTLELHYISAHKELIYKAVNINQAEAKTKLVELIELYIKGHEEIMVFYPDLKINPADIEKLNYYKFKKAVDDKLNNYNFPTNDFYALSKYKDGFFDEEYIKDDPEPIVLKKYKENFDKLISPLAQIFPNYFQ
ncbi:exodeoxyribonuclease V subunit gamma [Pedobacter alpinus]|uniref:RecBCD enzyme subunit RecC n=1 Tax=Pedobacter alpinus TaxID=1590643 RepID=A0ABW5TW51_9SPHI